MLIGAAKIRTFAEGKLYLRPMFASAKHLRRQKAEIKKRNELYRKSKARTKAVEINRWL